ncbi:MAG: NAD(P)H-hydrate dehydratase [Chloroflexi bacterium]|nr:NAD(P)H-hydrate dehydratase [Chloroflexota bacterium]
MKIVSVEQMRALEAAAFAAGTSEAELQQRAGDAVAEEVLPLATGRVAVLVGHGNNGRDGAVAAKWLRQRGLAIDLVFSPRHAITPEEVAQFSALGATITRSEDRPGVEGVLGAASLAIDALAGIGAKGALREPLASLAALVNAHHGDLHVVALDLPSGIDADTGVVPGEAVWADTTVALGGVKQGLLRFPAAERVGRLIPREIGIPSTAERDIPYAVLEPLGLAPARPLNAHKYKFGRVLVIAGSDHFLGAPVLCAGAAGRIGAGLITVASTRDVRLNVAAHLPEVTFTTHDVRADEGAAAARQVEPYLHSHNAVVLGPGLGRGPATTAFVAEVLRLRSREHSIVIDADGLVALSELDGWPQRLGPNVVLTPHAGELQRLVGHELDEAEPDWQRAGRLAREWGCVLAAKGPFTAVAAPDGRVDVWTRANAALAAGGTGDVLAGVTAGLLAQGLSPWDGARLAVALHGLAAARIVEKRGWRTLLASDLFAELPRVLSELNR